MPPHTVFKAEELHKVYQIGKNDLQVLKGISFEVFESEIVSIVGESGVGKSTLLHLMGGLDRPTTGRVTIEQQDITALSDEALARFRGEQIGFVFQFHHLLPEFDAFENTLMPALIAGRNRREARDRAEELLSLVGLSDRLQHKPGELSGGEQQRVAIARALMNQPKLVLADEPTGNLDKATSETLFDLILKLASEMRQTFVIVTHNESIARRSDRILELVDGAIGARGNGEA